MKSQGTVPGENGGPRDPHDPIAQLHRLREPIQPAPSAARTLRMARALFVRQHQQGTEFPTITRLWRLYLGAEPVLVASIAVIYLGWAWGTLASLWR